MDCLEELKWRNLIENISFPNFNLMKKLYISWSALILFFLSLGLLISCDCVQYLQGYAIDAETGKPLSNVYYSRDSLLTSVEKQNLDKDSFYRHHWQTDSSGWFMDMRLADGLTCKPHLVLWFDKDGYNPVKIKWNKSNSDTLVVEMNKILE